MRQAGYLAAAGIFALDNNINRLKEDRDHALLLGAALSNVNSVCEVYPIHTNIVLFTLTEQTEESDFFSALEKENILAISMMSNKLCRMVTHLGISRSDVDRVIDVLKKM